MIEAGYAEWNTLTRGGNTSAAAWEIPQPETRSSRFGSCATPASPGYLHLAISDRRRWLALACQIDRSRGDIRAKYFQRPVKSGFEDHS